MIVPTSKAFSYPATVALPQEGVVGAKPPLPAPGQHSPAQAVTQAATRVPALRDTAGSPDAARPRGDKPEVNKYDAAYIRFKESKLRPALKFSGSFISAPAPSEWQPPAEKKAESSERQAAMASAYHHGRRFSDSSRNLARLDNDLVEARARLAELTRKQADGDTSDGLAQNIKAHESLIGFTSEQAMNQRMTMERARAGLNEMFQVTGPGLVRQEGRMAPTGFSVSHDSLGQIMEFGADGGVRLIDPPAEGQE